jgi:hypothetical protein
MQSGGAEHQALLPANSPRCGDGDRPEVVGEVSGDPESAGQADVGPVAHFFRSPDSHSRIDFELSR